MAKWSNHAKLIVGDVDCDQSAGLCESTKHPVDGYPTLLYGDGSAALAEYHGDQTVSGMHAFAQQVLSGQIEGDVMDDMSEDQALDVAEGDDSWGGGADDADSDGSWAADSDVLDDDLDDDDDVSVGGMVLNADDDDDDDDMDDFLEADADEDSDGVDFLDEDVSEEVEEEEEEDGDDL